MNRALKKQHKKGCSFRANGGGYGMGAPLVPFQNTDDLSFSVKVPINQPFSDCAFPARPGHLDITPRPELAQTVMAGGRKKRSATRRGGFRSEYMPVNVEGSYKVNLPITQGFPNCGGVNVPSTLMSQANPALAQTAMVGGRKRSTRRFRGGNRGVAVDPSISIGGDGPNAAPIHSPIPCDIRAGSTNPLGNMLVHPDPRAPSDLYSLTPNQTGGSYGLGNGYSDACYKAPGSSLPVYPATTAGFHFEPSTAHGASLPDGVTAFNEVVPHAARMGAPIDVKMGGRRTQRKQRKLRRTNRRTNRMRKN